MSYKNNQLLPTSGSKRPRIEFYHNTPENSYDRFFQITLKEGSFKTISPFLINKSLQSYFGNLADIRKQSDGSLLIEVTNEKQSISAGKFTHLHEYEVSTSPHKSLNIVKGVITCSDLSHCSDEEILENLEEQGVISLYRIPPKKGTDKPSSTFILSFHTHQLPKQISAGFHSLRVRQYIPNPMRCFKCQKFGHTAIRCPNPETCPSCGHPTHPEQPCPSTSKCCNCQENHSPRYKGCRVYKQEFEIQKIRTQDKLPYFEAKRKYTSLFPAIDVSYSSVLSRGKPQMATIGIQCDISPTSFYPVTIPPTDSTSKSSNSQTKINTSQSPCPKSSVPQTSSSHSSPSTPTTQRKIRTETSSANTITTAVSHTQTSRTKNTILPPKINPPPKPNPNSKTVKKKQKGDSTKNTPNSSAESLLDITTPDFMEMEHDLSQSKSRKN